MDRLSPDVVQIGAGIMAFPSMRRRKQQLSTEECEYILGVCTTGVLAVHGTDGYPYTVPLNYVHWNGSVYFHCAKSGHKIDAIMRDPKVSFCVIERDDVVPEMFATAYRSVIVFGTADIVDNPVEVRDSLEALGCKYNPDDEHALRAEIDKDISRVLMVRIDIDHMTGKQASALV